MMSVEDLIFLFVFSVKDFSFFNCVFYEFFCTISCTFLCMLS